MPPSRIATLSAVLAVAALALLAGPPVAIQLGALESIVGFYLFLLGALLGVLALGVGLVGLVTTRQATGRPGRGRAVVGALAGLAVVATVGMAASRGAGLPQINDITTDPSDPPAFVAATEAPANRGKDMSYPGAFAAQQRQAYPDLAPIHLDAPPEEAFDQVTRAIEKLGWTLTRRAPADGAIEASQTSRIFRFVDDVVVRIRPASGGSVVDVRSRSRDGRGDLGVNAARIRRLRDALLAG